jgi:plasmid stability protein
MAELLIRGLNHSVLERLRKRAQKNHRSLEAEARVILEQAASIDMESALELADRIRKRFKGRRFDDSAALIREDRGR